MLVLALTLAIAGSALLVGAVLTFWHTRRTADATEAGAEWQLPCCEAPSPDDNLACDQEFGHSGWHRYGTESWFGDAWDVDHWADTQQRVDVDPNPTMSASDWKTREDPPIVWGAWQPKKPWRQRETRETYDHPRYEPNWQFYYDANPYKPPVPPQHSGAQETPVKQKRVRRLRLKTRQNQTTCV
jgi:hypothetical protein